LNVRDRPPPIEGAIAVAVIAGLDAEFRGAFLARLRRAEHSGAKNVRARQDLDAVEQAVIDPRKERQRDVFAETGETLVRFAGL